ncbi:hypothetical protein BM536_008505 [Streptomyces phaeoluteigriseus]|uniref:Uncharacterized protein n=1 Tax=Streptomyces phaeoluteigriseus TaxID=114686 RepID=A0A1V6MV49_9ACTN|nr:hypothetical protein BM536_008505 [Streptomyces phaeoluteigriseus]
MEPGHRLTAGTFVWLRRGARTGRHPLPNRLGDTGATTLATRDVHGTERQVPTDSVRTCARWKIT